MDDDGGQDRAERAEGHAEQLMTLLASLVSVDATALAAVGALDDPGVDAARLAVDDWTQRHEAMRREAGPALALVRSWLLHNGPEPPRRVLVHADFEPGTAMVRDVGKRVG